MNLSVPEIPKGISIPVENFNSGNLKESFSQHPKAN
jgi:hypothetical protein